MQGSEQKKVSKWLSATRISKVPQCIAERVGLRPRAAEMVLRKLSFLTRIRFSNTFPEIFGLLPNKKKFTRMQEWIESMNKTFVFPRKYMIQNTPFRDDLRPDYVFNTEAVWVNGKVHLIHTIVAPSVIVCNQWDADSVGYSVRSFDPHRPITDKFPERYDCTRIQTKDWVVTNPLYRMLLIWLHRHKYCTHRFEAEKWVEQVKAEWPEASMRPATWKRGLEQERARYEEPECMVGEKRKDLVQ